MRVTFFFEFGCRAMAERYKYYSGHNNYLYYFFCLGGRGGGVLIFIPQNQNPILIIKAV